MTRASNGLTYKQWKGANTGPSKTCMFIAGERPYGPNPWCSKAAVEDSSYCVEHHARCYTPIDNKKARDFSRHAEYLSRISK